MLKILRQNPFLVFTPALLVIITLYYSLSQLRFDGENVLYMPIIFYRSTAIYMVWVALLGFLFTFLYIIWKRPFRKGLDIAYSICLILLFLAIPFSCWTSIPFFAECGTGFNHVDQVRHEESTYQLAFSAAMCQSKASYSIYRCDSLGFVCERLHQLDVSYGTTHEALGNYLAAQNINLIVEPQTNTISIQNDGMNIFTLRLES